MVHLKHLEKALETSIAEGSIGDRESIIDDFLNANEPITASASSRLHDLLYRVWTSDEVQKSTANNNNSNNNSADSSLHPVSSNVGDSTIRAEPLPPDPRVVFLQFLCKLGPCLINRDQLQLWWQSLRYFAIDSTGYRLDLVDQSKAFLSGVLSGSFYEYGDSGNAELYTELSASYGRPALELFLSHKLPDDTAAAAAPTPKDESKGGGGEATDERIRFLRQNCRALFGQFARKETRTAFTIIDEYFRIPKYRIDVLDLVVEYLSESQESKLFRIYESPFFESLLTCIERDKARLAIQLAVTALSMFLVDICDKLVVNNLLFRVFGCFGRACSWQPSAPRVQKPRVNALPDQTSRRPSESGAESGVESGAESGAESGGEDNSATTTATSDSWEVLEDEPVDEDSDGEIEAHIEDTIDVISLFTFLYGLFPINTLQFCRNCDEYFAKHNYKKQVANFWSRFMVQRRADDLVRCFRIDPLLVHSTEESELATAIERFKAVGSALGLASICTSRRIVDVSGEPDDESKGAAAETERLLEDHRQAFGMRFEGTAGYWQRELLLMRNELAFAKFSRDMSEQRALRWQKRASDRAVMEVKIEELTRQNELLRVKTSRLMSETQRAMRSARTIMRERSAYESKILNRNREFRDQVTQLEAKLVEAQKSAESAQAEVLDAEKRAASDQRKTAEASEQLKALHNDLEVAMREVETSGGRLGNKVENYEDKTSHDALQNKIDTLTFKMEKMAEEHSQVVKALQGEVLRSQADLASAKLGAQRPRSDEQPQRRGATIAAVAKEKTATISRLRAHNEDLSRRCAALEHELRARKVHEEERLNELQAALLSSRPYSSQESIADNRFRGRGGAQGIPRRA